MAIKTIFFDFGNVIATFEFERFIERFTAHTGVSPEALHDVLFGSPTYYGYSELFRQFECGEISPGKFFHLLTTLLDCTRKISYADFAAYWADIDCEENSALEHILSRCLQEKLLLSNTNKIMHERRIAEMPLIKRHFPFHRRMLSYRMGTIKPEGAIYQKALRFANTQPEETLLIDDLEINIEGWRAIGGIGICYHAGKDSIESLEAQLINLGVFT